MLIPGYGSNFDNIFFFSRHLTLHNYTIIYRHLKNQGEILNCDLTNQNSSTLDPYNTQHLLVDAVTDFYDRLERDEEKKDCLNIASEKKDIEENFEADEPLKTPTAKRPTLPALIEPQRGNDDQLSIKLETLELEASG